MHTISYKSSHKLMGEILWPVALVAGLLPAQAAFRGQRGQFADVLGLGRPASLPPGAAHLAPGRSGGESLAEVFDALVVV